MNETIDNLCDEFEAQIAGGKRPRVEDYLERVDGPLKRTLVRELLLLERELVRDVDWSDYRRRLPDFADEIRNICDQTVAPTDQKNAPSAPSVRTGLGRRIGRYKLLQEIGEGGMGKVWMAEQREPVRRRVAIKVIKAGVADEKFVARFEAERQALAMMNHQNIARVLDGGNTEQGTPYFVMELVQGVPITEFCDQGSLNLRSRLELFIPVCRAVHHAHQKGIIHRDLKPSNVLVSTYEGEAVPKVIDFGLAKTLQPEIRLTEKTMFTEFGQIVGTVQYMSPEQATLDGMDIDTRTDIYSLGVMLYELLTGSTPIDQETLRTKQLLQVLEIIREREPPRPSHRLTSSGENRTAISERRRTQPDRLRRLLAGDLDWIVMKAIDADRNRRYESAVAFAEDIRNYLDGQRITAHPPSTLYSIRKFVRRYRTAVAMVLALATMLLLATAVSTRFAFHANEKRREAEVAKDQARESAEAANVAKTEALSAKARSDYFVTAARWSDNRVRDAIAGLERIPEEYRDFEWHLDRRLYEGSDGFLYGHKSRIRDIEFDPQNNRVLTASSDGTVRLWDVITQQVIAVFQHAQPVYAATFATDEEHIATIDGACRISIWDVASPRRVREFTFDEEKRKLSSSDLCDLEFSQDGRTLAVAAASSVAKVFNVESGESRIVGKHDDKIFSLAFSPDAARLATASVDKSVRVWQLDGSESWELTGHEAAVFDVAFSPDGNSIASASEDQTVRVWDADTTKLLQTLRGHVGTVYCVNYSPDGLRISSGSSDESIRVWHVESGEELLRLRADNWVRDVSFSGDGSALASAVAKNGQLWDVVTGINMRTLDGHQASVADLEFSSDGALLVSSAKDKTVKVWDLASGDCVASFDHDSQVNDVAIYGDGSRLLSASQNGRIRLWDVGQRLEVMPVADEVTDSHAASFFRGAEARGVAVSPNGGQYAKGLADGTVRLWDSKANSFLTLRHAGSLRSIDFNHDGSLLASASTDATIKLWQAATGKLLRTLGGDGQGHSKGIYQARFSPDGSLLASASQDDSVRVWDVDSGQELCRPLQVAKGPDFYAVSFKPDNSRLAAACGDGTIRIWDISRVREGQVQEVRTLPSQANASITGFRREKSPGSRAVAFRQDGNLLATGADSGEIRLWNGAPYRATVLLLGHFESVKAYAFSRDGDRIVTGSTDKTVRVWNVADGSVVGVYRGHTRTVVEVAFSLDSKTIYSRDEDGFEVAWHVESTEPIEPKDPAHWDPVQPAIEVPQVVLDGRRVILVNPSMAAGDERTVYNNFKFAPNLAWHRRLANSAERQERWYAATFHRGWSVLAGGNERRDYNKLKQAFREFRKHASEDGSKKRALAKLPSKVKEALQSVGID